MRAYRLAVATLAAVIVFVASIAVGRGQQPTQVPASPGIAAPSPLGYKGEALFPAFEGWGPLKDGQNAILIGYNNRNKDQTIDIPVGPNNHIDPGGPDMMQPTHFEPGRHWGVFSIPVAKDFGTKKITWTIVANGLTSQVQFSLNPPYWVDFYKNAAKGNTPPVIKFAQDGPEMTGPPKAVAMNMTATVGQPLKLTLWAKDKPNTYDPEDSLPPELRTPPGGRGGRGGRGRGTTTGAADPNAPADPNAAGGAAAARGGRGRGDNQNFDFSAATSRNQGPARGGGGGALGRGAGPQPDVTVTWKLHRGASPVKFADDVIKLFNKGDDDAVMEATTTATFSAAGDYMLRAQVNDNSGDGGGGEQCCWTNALVKVTVK
jgi:hypothetical protein